MIHGSQILPTSSKLLTKLVTEMNQGTVLALGKRQSRADFPLRVVELNLLALASDFVDYSDPSERPRARRNPARTAPKKGRLGAVTPRGVGTSKFKRLNDDLKGRLRLKIREKLNKIIIKDYAENAQCAADRNAVTSQ